MDNLFTLKSALQFSEEGRIEEWIHLFLNGEGDNVPFSKGLKLEKRYYTPPLKIPLNLFTRCCGPEDHLKYTIDKYWFEKNVQSIMERHKNGWDMPPIIVNYFKGEYELNDGNHRYEALVRSGHKDFYVIVWTSSENDYEDFNRKGYK